ncbi:MAG: hypothetical protein QN172_07420 [Armatimonadota bacterium]|nr:hypothetical protein [Armatimonadota bacterium]MDR7563659.1 hypothetical protein [Armatimonadota bacterium]MDR7567453.1 hypothetical protein [Armatimonadota bacterium]MDR7602274.1 hypothetical protein [Armatimonadota bacterium]
MNEQLWAAYERVCMDEMRPIEEFVERIRAGEFGSFDPHEVAAFLREIQSRVLQNIELKAAEHPFYAARMEAVAEQQRRLFEALIAQFESEGSG